MNSSLTSVFVIFFSGSAAKPPPLTLPEEKWAAGEAPEGQGRMVRWNAMDDGLLKLAVGALHPREGGGQKEKEGGESARDRRESERARETARESARVREGRESAQGKGESARER